VVKTAIPKLEEILTGRTSGHVISLDESGPLVHAAVRAPLIELRKKAARAGFDLQVVSGFRDFASQLKIWNLKAQGQRPLLDHQGNPLDFASLTPIQIIFAILRWSAVPGGSRHHWGTDFDVIDKKAVPSGYRVQLTPAEVSPKGMFGPFHAWLDANMGKLGFFRPYCEDLGGISPERWHLSYAPVAEGYLEALTLDILEGAIESADMELKELVLDDLETIFDRYVNGISHA
jgi:LAS superfamily LD-carboxypeptidase LdcB